MKNRFTDDFLLRGLCELLNERYIFIVETKNSQEIIYYNDKILTRD